MATLWTQLCDHRAIQHPAVQAPIGSLTSPPLAAPFDGGWPGRDHRTLVTGTVHRREAAGGPSPRDGPDEGEMLAEFASGREVGRCADRSPSSGVTGDPSGRPQAAGQSVGYTRNVQPAGSTVRHGGQTAVERMPSLEGRLEVSARALPSHALVASKAL